MEIAKSIFRVVPDGYTDGKLRNNGMILEDENDFSFELSEKGGPFSAITPSLRPESLIMRLSEEERSDEPNHQPDFRFDEFGFKVEEEDGPEQSSSKLLSQPFIEDSEHRLEWIAYLKTGSDSDDLGELDWNHVCSYMPQTGKLRSLIKKGIPHSLRPELWLRLSGALLIKEKSDIKYQDLVKASSNNALVTNKQIERDVLKVMPSNACFSSLSSTGIPRLRRVMRALAWLYRDIGYCQGTGVIAASLLLFLEEEETFWMMCSIVEDLLPASYYSSNFLGVQADQNVLRSLLSSHLPGVQQVLEEHDIDVSLITSHWFITLFASVLHMKILLRVWDLLFSQGSIVLFQVTLAMIKIKETYLSSLQNSAQVFNVLSDIPRDIDDVENLFEVLDCVCESLCGKMVEDNRRKYLACLMADHGAFINPKYSTNLPKQHLNKREMCKSKSVLDLLVYGDSPNSTEQLRNKNIRQTEMLVDLRQSILQLAHHFQNIEPSFIGSSLDPDYSLQSHSEDLFEFLATMNSRRRRAKALLDFERHDDDELGFRKNDIITVISQKDEHCWIGELNGLRGWFPAKFVELLDERSKEYNQAGDDAITASVTDLVRGNFCPTLKAILLHGMKPSSILGTTCHPWLFIEEASSMEVEKDFSSVYSRLVLCRTFRLDEDGKVLTPEQLLYRSVQAINISHDAAHAQMDIKLRSLICLGLNEQVLHLWLEILCSSSEAVKRWYEEWSFLRSPCWVQIKCELRILARFPFRLNPDWELPPHATKNMQPLREGVRDMLVKHHLFSWDL